MWVVPHVAIDGINGFCLPREALTGCDISVLVVPEEDMAGVVDVPRPVLGLPVEAHDAIVTADSQVVLRRYPARIVEGPLSGEDHSGFRRHDQDAARMHQHRGFGIPVGLGPYVDSSNNQFTLAAA